MTEYEKIDAIRWSDLKHLDVSPLAFQHRLQSEHSDSADMRVGRAIHTLLLEPDKASERHPVFEGAARRGKAWEQFCAEHPGADILSREEWRRAMSSAAAVVRHPDARRYVESSQLTEHVLTWADDDTGLRCKARVDACPRLVELKSANSRAFNPRRWPSHAADLKYHGQVAYYSDGLEANGHPFLDYPVLIVVESEPPHDVAVYETDEEYLSAGRRLYRRLLRRYLECMERDSWPGVCANGPLRMTLPAWADEPSDEPPKWLNTEVA